jgi:hypothetical protein
LLAPYDIRIKVRKIGVGIVNPLCAHEASLVGQP